MKINDIIIFVGGFTMAISYDPLWNMLDRLNISKMEFAKRIDISNATLSKFSKNEPVTLTVIDKICNEFDCDIKDIVKHTRKTICVNPDNLRPCTIIKAAYHSLGTPVRYYNHDFTDVRDCVILDCGSVERNNETTYFYLIAPLSYKKNYPIGSFKQRFPDIEIDGAVQNGYIELSLITEIQLKMVKGIIGTMPQECIDKSLEMVRDLKPAMIKHGVMSEVMFGRYELN